MRITYRNLNNKEYWNRRWQNLPLDKFPIDDNFYPLKYAKKVIIDKKGLILEAGCGAGRILNYYDKLGYKIVGVDFFNKVIKKINKLLIKAEEGDIRNLDLMITTFNTYWLLVFITILISQILIDQKRDI